ncbi:hypothetical protein [Nocardia jejuensis]|uniref:hypothetical protein n=1 Tax=Nocardia jejuensis TaxID=328049 RepID=UPI0008328D2F|nr:hypothetical protein [Nocardia jejuensis]
MTHPDASEERAETAVEAVEVDAELLAFSTLEDIHHGDAHLLFTDYSGDYSAEQWARIILENVPGETRIALERAWQIIALRLRAVGTAHTVAGWPIAHVDPEYVLLHTASDFGFEGQLLFRRNENSVLLATFVRFHDPAARAVWDRALPAHLGFVRTLLAASADRLADTSAANH